MILSSLQLSGQRLVLYWKFIDHSAVQLGSEVTKVHRHSNLKNNSRYGLYGASFTNWIRTEPQDNH